MSSHQPKGMWKWRLNHPADDTILTVTMDKETAMDFCINLYKAINNPENQDIMWSMQMHNFLNLYTPKNAVSNPSVSSDKPPKK